MRKRTKFKSPVLDFFVVVFTLSVAGYFGYTFWKDLNSSSKRNDKEKIAIITFKNRIAQRKYEDRVVWERIDKSTPLYNGDLIRTAELAEAVITFNDGSEVNIYENTMIQVYYSDYEGVQIDVGNGNLQLESSNKGKVQLTLSDGSKVNAGGGTSLSTKTSSSGLGPKTVEVRSGSAVVTGASGNSEAISAGESLSVKDDGEISKKAVTVTSIPPELKVLNIEGEKVPVKLEWNKIKTDEPVVLQTSTKKDFSVVSEEKIITSKNDALIDISDGTVYWRIYPENNKEEVSEGKISVESAKPLTLITPSPDGILKYRNRNPEVNFRWNGNEFATSYLLKVSSTPDMQNSVLSTIVENPSAQINSLGNGQWWWQVTPFYELSSLGYADAGASEVAGFTIEKQDAINPPSLTIPLQDAEIHYKETLDVNFSWKSDIKATFELLVSENKDFTDIVSRKKTAGQRAVVNLEIPSDEGHTYYWKVIRNSSEPDDFSPESDIRSFTVSKYVSIPTKLLYPPEEYSTETSKLSAVRFMWKPADEAKSKDAVVQVSTSSDFSDVKLEETVSGSTLENLSLPQGEYYWRVATENEEGKLEYTQPNHLVVKKELTAPKITNIKNNDEVVIAKNSSVKVRWTAVSGADCYNVRVFDTENNLVAEKPEASGTSTNFILPDDSYQIKIQAVTAQTETSPIRTGPVETVDFSVRTPTSISTLRPASYEHIDGLTALRTPVVFTWKNSSDKAASTELILKKRQNDGSLKVVERLKVNKNTVSIPRLTTGSYTWQIVASTPSGIPLDSEVSTFTVTAVRDLPLPVLQNPQKDFVMDAAYLRKNRSISFEWEAVPDATEYNFVIYKKQADGSLVPVWSEKGVKTNKVRLRKLSVLDVGNFEWYVTAFSYAKDGYEERRSPVSKASFKISFESPKKITTDNNGRMFSED